MLNSRKRILLCDLGVVSPTVQLMLNFDIDIHPHILENCTRTTFGIEVQGRGNNNQFMYQSSLVLLILKALIYKDKTSVLYRTDKRAFLPLMACCRVTSGCQYKESSWLHTVPDRVHELSSCCLSWQVPTLDDPCPEDVVHSSICR